MRLLWLLLLIPLCSCYKILVFSPTISRSHMISNGRIADTLALAGHEVVMVEPDFLGIFDKVNPTKVAKRMPIRGFSNAMFEAIKSFSSDSFSDPTALELHLGLLKYNRASSILCEEFFSRDDVMEQLRAEKFDAFFSEQVNLCGPGVAHALGIKTQFWISSCPVHETVAWAVGSPIPVSYVPALIGVDMAPPFSYWQRAKNLLWSCTHLYFYQKADAELTQLFRNKFGKDFPAVDKLAGNSDLVFVATDEFVDFPGPILPNMVNIGGLGLEDTKQEIGEVFDNEMEKGKEGVVYFSLGTIVNTTILPQFVMKSLIDTVKKFPEYHFILKADKYDKWAAELSAGVKNLYLADWVPQAALLRHARLKVFVTHSGYNSVMEAARAGVPILAMPFIWDQPRNSQAVALNGWGIASSRFHLRDDPSKLEAELRDLLTNSKYKKAALRIQRLIISKPFNASERLVKNTEFVLANGGMKELLVEGRNMSLIHYYNLDIFVPALFVLYFAFCALLRLVVSVFTVNRSKSERKQKKH